MTKFEEFLKRMLKVGTPECGLFTGIAALVLALLLIFAGFWKTLLIAVLVALGVFLGLVDHKKDAVRNVVNRLFPPKDGGMGGEV